MSHAPQQPGRPQPSSLAGCGGLLLLISFSVAGVMGLLAVLMGLAHSFEWLVT